MVGHSATAQVSHSLFFGVDGGGRMMCLYPHSMSMGLLCQICALVEMVMAHKLWRFWRRRHGVFAGEADPRRKARRRESGVCLSIR